MKSKQIIILLALGNLQGTKQMQGEKFLAIAACMIFKEIWEKIEDMHETILTNWLLQNVMKFLAGLDNAIPLVEADLSPAVELRIFNDKEN